MVILKNNKKIILRPFGLEWIPVKLLEYATEGRSIEFEAPYHRVSEDYLDGFTGDLKDLEIDMHIIITCQQRMSRFRKLRSFENAIQYMLSNKKT